MMLDRGARFLDERRVAHAGRAGGFARHAAEAGVEMTRDRCAHGDAALDAGPIR